MSLITLADIQAAAARIAPAVVRTPLIRLTRARLRLAGFPQLADDTPDIYLKDESAQPIGSFKLRGAYNAIAQLSPGQLRRGVITYSSGNHAQGVAYAARALGSRAVIVMPSNAPHIKREATAALGAEIVTVGAASTERKARAEQLAAQHGYTIIPPYDHPDIIAGQATCGLEIMEQLPHAGLILAPVSGGGLLAGVAAAIKLAPGNRPAVQGTGPAIHFPEAHANPPEGVRLQPCHTSAAEEGGFSPRGTAPLVYGIEPALAADAYASFTTRTLTEWPAADTSRTLCDGLRTQSLGTLNFAHILAHVDGILTIPEAEIRLATRIILQATSLTAEPSGAITLAAALFHHHELPRARKIVAILSGGNLEPTLQQELASEAASSHV